MYTTHPLAARLLLALARAVQKLDLLQPDPIAVPALALREGPAEVLHRHRPPATLRLVRPARRHARSSNRESVAILLHLVDDEVPVVAGLRLLVVHEFEILAVVRALEGPGHGALAVAGGELIAGDQVRAIQPVGDLLVRVSFAAAVPPCVCTTTCTAENLARTEQSYPCNVLMVRVPRLSSKAMDDTVSSEYSKSLEAVPIIKTSTQLTLLAKEGSK